MSRKVKSDLSFVLKVSVLFMILLASKIYKTDIQVVASAPPQTEKDSVTFASLPDNMGSFEH